MRARLTLMIGLIGSALLASGCSTNAPVASTPKEEAPASADSGVPSTFTAFANDLRAQPDSAETTGTAWYPTYVPTGFVLESIETTELDPANRTGLVCDVIFANGARKIVLSQGSPVARDYEIVDIDTVAWGSAEAWTMDADGDPGGAQFIVYADARNLGELRGDVSIDELKKMAASMRPVP